MTDVGEQHRRGHCIDKRKSSCVARNLMTSVTSRPSFSPFSLFAGHCGVEQVERREHHDREEVQLEDLWTLTNPHATQPKHMTQAHILRESLIIPPTPPQSKHTAKSHSTRYKYDANTPAFNAQHSSCSSYWIQQGRMAIYPSPA